MRSGVGEPERYFGGSQTRSVVARSQDAADVLVLCVVLPLGTASAAVSAIRGI